MNLLSGDIKSRKVAVLVADGVDETSVDALKKALQAEGAHAKVLGPTSAPVKTAAGGKLAVDAAADGLPSIAFDAVWVAGGEASAKALSGNGVTLHYLLEAYKHLKAIGVNTSAKAIIDVLKLEADAGLIIGDGDKAIKAFIAAIAQHRVWDREDKAKAIPA
jgi:catalase